MIKIENLSKKYDKELVLNNLNCTINGAGKSTLLRLINGIFKADSGSILIDNNEVFDNETVKQNLVFVPDDLFFYSGYTLLDTAKYYEAMYKKFDMEYLKHLASILKLDVNRKISTLSKGMKHQCALIIAKEMEENNTTIVMTSHNLRELEDICDNLGLLYKGGILFESEIDNIKTNMFKVQISFKDDYSKDKFKDLDILSFKKVGSVSTLIINDKDGKTKKKLEKLNPIILDYLPLTLEEVFIYEMEALGYEFNEVI